MATEMYLTLPSNTKDFTSNTSSTFRVNLPNPLELSGEWQVALVEIQYPHSWYNLNDPDGNWIMVWSMELEKANYNSLVQLDVPSGSYTDVDELLSAIQREMKGLKTPVKTLDLNRNLKLEYTPLDKRIRLKMHPKAIKSVMFGKQLQYMLGLDDQWPKQFHKSVHLAKYPPDLTAGFNTIFVYSDIVQPQVVGNTLVPLLRTVPTEGKYGDSVDRVFLAPHYIPLRTKTINSVEIAIKDDTDTPVKFNFGKVIVKLHLRQVQP